MPDKELQVGNTIILDPKSNNPSGPWTIEFIGLRKSMQEVLDRSQDYKQTRKASNI